MTQLTPTEIESLRIAIAELVGWICCADYGSEKFFHKGDPTRQAMWPDSYHHLKLPPYTTSLDAIQAAAMERFKTTELKTEFQYRLHRQCETSYDMEVWTLSALDWCIAFAKTSKIWRYKE